MVYEYDKNYEGGILTFSFKNTSIQYGTIIHISEGSAE